MAPHEEEEMDGNKGAAECPGEGNIARAPPEVGRALSFPF